MAERDFKFTLLLLPVWKTVLYELHYDSPVCTFLLMRNARLLWYVLFWTCTGYKIYLRMGFILLDVHYRLWVRFFKIILDTVLKVLEVISHLNSATYIILSKIRDKIFWTYARDANITTTGHNSPSNFRIKQGKNRRNDCARKGPQNHKSRKSGGLSKRWVPAKQREEGKKMMTLITIIIAKGFIALSIYRGREMKILLTISHRRYQKKYVLWRFVPVLKK